MQAILAEAGWAPARRGKSATVLAFEARHGDTEGLALLRLVAAELGMVEAVLLHRQRCRQQVARARQLAMYLMHVVLGRVYLDVGRFFGRDRTTVSHACALIEDLRDDPQFDAEVSRLERRLSMRREVKHARA